MSYLCDSCGASFDDPTWVREYQGEHFGAPAYETLSTCPYCGGEDYQEGQSCALCGQDFPGEELENGVCPTCLGETVKALRRLVEQHFSPAEIALLHELDWQDGLL